MFYHLEVMKTMIRKLWIRNALHTLHLSAYLCFIDHVWMLLMLGNLEEIDLLKTSSKFFLLLIFNFYRLFSVFSYDVIGFLFWTAMHFGKTHLSTFVTFWPVFNFPICIFYQKKRVKDPFAKMSNFFLLSIFEAICSLSLICWRQLLWNLCSKIVSIPKCSKIAHNKSFHSWCEIFAHLGNIGGLHSI